MIWDAIVGTLLQQMIGKHQKKLTQIQPRQTLSMRDQTETVFWPHSLSTMYRLAQKYSQYDKYNEIGQKISIY